PTGINTDSDRPANVVEDDRYIWKRVRETRELVDLRVEQPRVERQAETAEHGEAFSETRFNHKMRLRDVCRVTHGRVGVHRRDMANAAEAVAARTGKGHQDRLDPAAEHQVRMSDNASADPCLAIGTAGAHCRNAVDELDLAHRPQLDGAGRAVHRARLDENS